MERSPETRKKFIRGVVLFVFSVVSANQSISGTAKAIQNLNRFETGCATEGLDLDNSVFDTIVIPGSTSVLTENGEYLPDTVMRARLDAAAWTYVHSRDGGVFPKLIILNSEWDEGNYSSVDYLVDTVKRISNGQYELSGDDVVNVQNSINTSSGTAVLSEMAEGGRLGRIVIVTNKVHGCRQDALAYIYDVPDYSLVLAEDVLLRMEGRNNLNPSTLQDDSVGQERLKILLMVFDNHAIMQNVIKGVMQPIKHLK